MDVFHLTVSGWIGKVYGWRRDRYRRDYYKFSMATHRVKGSEQETLWLNVAVPDPLCNIASERGLIVGEQILVMTDFAELAAVIQGAEAKAFLNVTARQLVFLSNPALPQLQREPGFVDRSDNIIDYNLLMNLKAQRTENVEQRERVG